MEKNYPGKLHKVEGLSRKTKMVYAEEDIKSAYEHCSSLTDAAYQLGITIATFKKYAEIYKEEESGKTYYELFMERPASRAPNRYKGGEIGREKIERILRGDQTNTIKSVDQFKMTLLRYGFFREQCANCDYTGHRGRDLRSPLLVTFKDGDEKNGKQDNIEMLCFNCAFEICDTDNQFLRMVKDSMEELSATNVLHDKYIEKEKVVEPVLGDADDDLKDFLAKNGFDFGSE